MILQTQVAVLKLALRNGATLTLNTIVGMTITGVYTVGATGSGEDILDIGVATIDAQSVADAYDNTLTSTALPLTNISDGSDIDVDTTAPKLLSFTSVTPNATYGPGNLINITATYDDTPNPGSTVDVTLSTGASLTLNSIAGMTISGVYTVGATGSGKMLPI